MPTLAEIDAEIARRQAQPSLADIDAEIARRQQVSAAPDIPPVPGGRFMTEQEAQQQGVEIQGAGIVGQPLPAENDYPMQDIIEPLTTVATGAVAPMVAGAAGAADILNPFTNMSETAQMVESLQEAMTFIPRGEKARENLQFIAEKMAPVTKAMETVENTAGEAGYQVGGPVLGAISKAAPTAIMTALGIDNIRRGAVSNSIKEIPSVKALSLIKPKSKFKADTIERLKENAANPEIANEVRLLSDDLKNGAVAPGTVGTQLMVLEDKARKVSGNKSADKIKQVREDLEQGDVSSVDRLDKVADEMAEPAPERSLAKYIEDGAGKLKTDPIMKEAVKQGYDEGTVAAVKGASISDKSKMRKMLDIMKKGKENARYAVDNRPANVAGDSLLDRVKAVKQINRQAGSEINKVARSLRGQEVDSTEAIGNFMDSLSEMGVTINKNLKPRFKNSDVEFNAGAKAAIAGMIKRLSRGKPGAVPDAYEMHRMKLLIDDMVTYGKSGEGIKGKTERVLKKLRADIDNSLDSNFPEYDAVNTTYSETINALDSLQDVAGKKMDLFGPNADKATGTLLRRMMSNAQSRVNLTDAIDILESVNKKHGNYFDDDIKTLMLFTDELDDVFGPVARTSLAGEVSKGVRKAANADIRGAVAEVASSAVEKARGLNQANQFKVMMKLLER